MAHAETRQILRDKLSKGGGIVFVTGTIDAGKSAVIQEAIGPREHCRVSLLDLGRQHWTDRILDALGGSGRGRGGVRRLTDEAARRHARGALQVLWLTSCDMLLMARDGDEIVRAFRGWSIGASSTLRSLPVVFEIQSDLYTACDYANVDQDPFVFLSGLAVDEAGTLAVARKAPVDSRSLAELVNQVGGHLRLVDTVLRRAAEQGRPLAQLVEPATLDRLLDAVFQSMRERVAGESPDQAQIAALLAGELYPRNLPVMLRLARLGMVVRRGTDDVRVTTVPALRRALARWRR